MDDSEKHEKEPRSPINIRLHHITGLYYTLCLTPEEQARTPMFNDANKYGEEFARKMYEFYENVLRLPDSAQIKVVGSIDDVCPGCPIVNDSCRLEDRQDDYEVPKQLKINVGGVITVGELKEKMQALYPQHDAPWKGEKWKKTLEKNPDFATKYTVGNFWLYKQRKI